MNNLGMRFLALVIVGLMVGCATSYGRKKELTFL